MLSSNLVMYGINVVGTTLILCVFAHTENPITALVQKRAVLPCPCPQRNLSSKLTWQVGNKSILKLSGEGVPHIQDEYEDRVQLFQKNNCSLLIKSVRLSDGGTYKCNFFNPRYTHRNVVLRVLDPKPVRSSSPVFRDHWIFAFVCWFVFLKLF